MKGGEAGAKGLLDDMGVALGREGGGSVGLSAHEPMCRNEDWESPSSDGMWARKKEVAPVIGTFISLMRPPCVVNFKIHLHTKPFFFISLLVSEPLSSGFRFFGLRNAKGAH